MKPKLFKTQQIRNFNVTNILSCTTIHCYLNISQFIVKKLRLPSTFACLYKLLFPLFLKNLFPNIDIYENYFHLRIKIRLSTKKYLGTPNYNLIILALV